MFNKKITLSVNKISKSFGNRELFKDVSFSLFFEQKVGLIGPNGSGKSTLMKIIAGLVSSDEGVIEIFKNLKISYLPQEFDSEENIKSYVFGKDEGLFYKKSSLVCEKFNLEEEIFNKTFSELSGGQKTKVYLMKIYLEESAIILLDEPTNNLDSKGLEILSQIINSSKSAFLIISHDRSFLDKTVSKIIELDDLEKTINSYDGTYSDYLIEKSERDRRKNELYINNQRQISKVEKEISNHKNNILVNSSKSFSKDSDKYINTYKTEKSQKKNTGRMKNAQKKLEALESKDRVFVKRPLKIDFSEIKEIGSNVLSIEKLFLKFGSKKKIDLSVFSGDRIYVSGDNGSGKTTFLKTIMEKLEKRSGEINWSENVRVGYLPQDFLKEDNLDSIFIDLFMEKSGKNQSDSRKILFRFGFREQEVKSKTRDLSPGLRARGRIALMMVSNPNVLILDEPTNNLDLEVLEKFENELVRYSGTIIFTSHDKAFVEKIKPNKFLKF